MKKLKKDITEFTKSGMTLGIGSAVVAGIPGSGAITGSFATMGSMMSPVATGMMGMHAIRLTKKLYKKKKKRR